MPGKVKVKIISGKNLPVMDRSSDTTDAYVEIKLGNTTYKTEVCRRTLHPQWNSEWYRFEVDDSELQDEPLQIRLMDHDTYSANDAIGKVYLNLNPLLLPVVGELGDNNPYHEISGWIPVYDTMHGIRGEVNVTVKVEFFSDFNRFRQSSCGVHFFYSPTIPQGYRAKIINGFVEELIVDDDPEYQWIDKIRTPRASNEARQTLFLKLSGELQRKIGVKAMNLGANAVIGYKQCFDLEGESGIVARGIGTAVTLIRAINVPHIPESKDEHHCLPAHEKQETNGEKKDEFAPEPVTLSHSPMKLNNMIPLHRRSSDSDLSITPKGNSLTGSDRSVGNTAAYFMRSNYFRRGALTQENFEMLEYPFLTMSKFPPRFIAHIAGSINARSVKLLERITNVEEPESRDIWWSEIRMEIRSHARSLNCNAVLGYIESTSICEDVCVLSACGTAAVIDFNCLTGDDENVSHVQLIQKTLPEKDKHVNGQNRTSYDSPYHKEYQGNLCNLTHLPFDGKVVSSKTKFAKCLMCHKGRVPEVLVATIEPPDFLPSIGKGCFIEAHVLRNLKDLRGETIAKEISDGLPFLEYELHRLLINKLKIKGMNAVFGLQIRITVGEKMIVGVATGTAMYLASLPSPDLPMLVTNRAADEKKVAELQELLFDTVKKNREIYQIKDDNQNLKCFSDDESDEDLASLDLTYSFDSRDCYILEMDDPDDAEVLHLLMEDRVPNGFHVVNTEIVPGLDDLEIVKNLQMFTQIYRAKLAPPYNLQPHFVKILQAVYFKLRRMVPCALCDLQFRIALPEPDEVQLYVIGMALGLGKKTKKSNILLKKADEDLIFKLDEDHPQDSPPSHLIRSHPPSIRSRSHRSPSKSRPISVKHPHIFQNDRHGVDITPLSYVPGANIEQYLGNLNYFFIRETTSIREEGGLSGFIHSFVTEVLAIVRSHVTALGGNALVAFFMTECVLNHNLHKNQGQCLINVGGDVVSVSYPKDDT